MINIEEKWLERKKKIDRAKIDLAKNEGVEDQLKKQLVNDFRCKNLKAAKIKLDKISIEIENMEEEIKKKSSELEDKYEW